MTPKSLYPFFATPGANFHKFNKANQPVDDIFRYGMFDLAGSLLGFNFINEQNFNKKFFQGRMQPKLFGGMRP